MTVPVVDREAPELEVIDWLIAHSEDGKTLISRFVANMIDRGYTHEGAVAQLHKQVHEGNVAFDSLYNIVRR